MRISIYHFNLVRKCDILAPMARRLAPIALSALLALALPHAPMAQAEEARILAPSTLRQGDPLLAWALVEGDDAPAAAPSQARLMDAQGKAKARAACFPADELIDAQGPLFLRGDSGAASEGRASARPRARLYGILMALGPDLAPGDYRLEALGATAALSLEPRKFAFEAIQLDEANAALIARPSERAQAEARRLYAILDGVDEGALFAGPEAFAFPVEGGWKSAGFRDERRYDLPDGSSLTSVHAGIDWAVPTGTRVRACARGKVVLVADREVTGTTVVLEHLPGLYSLYFHLSKAEVEEGAIVERGQPIALSGATGLATGPHLHWEIRAAGEAVDPEYWLGPPLLDKTAVSAIIYGLIEGR